MHSDAKSHTVTDTAIVAIEGEYKTVPKLLNGTDHRGNKKAPISMTMSDI